MTVDLGAKNGIIAPDKKTEDYLSSIAKGDWDFLDSDSDAVYDAEYEVDISDIAPQVARPDKLDDVVPVDDVIGKNLPKCSLEHAPMVGWKTLQLQRLYLKIKRFMMILTC